MKNEGPFRVLSNVFRGTAQACLLAMMVLQLVPDASAAEKPEKLYKRALELRKKGKLEEARLSLQESLRLKPDNADTKAMLGLTCFQIGDQFRNQKETARALAMFQEAVTTDPDEAYWHAALAQILQANGNSEEAAKEFALAARLSPLDDALTSWRESAPAPDRAPEGSPIQSYAPTKSNISAPILLNRSEPPYPEKARRALHEGTVVLLIIVSPQGDVAKRYVVRPMGLGLDQSALQTVSYWKFEPGRKDGVLVDVRVLVEVQFKLKK